MASERARCRMPPAPTLLSRSPPLPVLSCSSFCLVPDFPGILAACYTRAARAAGGAAPERPRQTEQHRRSGDSSAPGGGTRGGSSAWGCVCSPLCVCVLCPFPVPVWLAEWASGCASEGPHAEETVRQSGHREQHVGTAREGNEGERGTIRQGREHAHAQRCCSRAPDLPRPVVQRAWRCPSSAPLADVTQEAFAHDCFCANLALAFGSSACGLH